MPQLAPQRSLHAGFDSLPHSSGKFATLS
jgi:hypothetical protein